MKQFFVIGNKASKSLSPLIFNYWFKKHKINANYSFVEVKKESFHKTLIKKIKDENVCGFNVTIPFKKNILKYVDNKNIHATKIGAVNCVTLGKKIKGTKKDLGGTMR